MAMRKRSGSGSKRQLKEKVVQIYESFFRGEDVSSNYEMFWDEFFLLKPKLGPLEAEIHKMSPEQIVDMKENINLLFNHCVDTLEQEHHIRVVYALQTLSAITNAVYQKLAQLPCSPNILGVLIGGDDIENKMQRLLLHCNKYLSGDVPDSLKSLVLKFLLVVVTGTDDVSNNVLLEYLMVNSLFESLIQLLSSSAEREQHGHDVVVLLTLLVNYKKQESANPYIVKLSILDDELALNGYGQVIRSDLGELRGRVAGDSTTTTPSPGWLASLTSMVGGMFLAGDDAHTTMQRTNRNRANNAALLALYEAAHLNRNFMTTLAHASARAIAPPSPPATLPTQQSPPNAAQLQLLDDEQPTNLLVTFFQYCSIVLQDTKTEWSINTCKLCFVILTCVVEDQYANSIMHDVNLTFKVQLHRLPMRHRKVSPEKEPPSQTLAATLIDLLVEFIMSHLMKKFPLELYVWCVGVVHRLLCYQKRCRVRIHYPWKELWSAMISLLKFLVVHESNLTKKVNIFDIALQIVNIFNLFIMYGDTFLPTPASYDLLYYELIRMNQVFDNLHYMALRYSTSDSEFKEKALRLANCLINVRAIINHFTPKIDGWLSSQSLSTPTEDQILEVVKKNYDSLTLKLQESLDMYERYSEKPFHIEFFQGMVKNMVVDTRQHVNYATLDLQSILHECSTIH